MRDNIDYYMEHEIQEERDHQRWVNSRPICEECGDHITSDFYWEIDDKVYCEDCAEELFRKAFWD